MIELRVCGRLLLAGIVGSLAAPLDASTYKVTWLVGHKNLDYFEDAAAEFKAAVETGSDGDIRVEIRAFEPDEEAAVPVALRVAGGEAELGHSFADVMGRLAPEMLAFDAPYLFRGYRHLEGVFEGPLGAEMLAGLRVHGLEGLAFTYSGGANGVATSDRELRSPEDLKGLKVGVYGRAASEGWLSRLGATAVPLGHGLKSIRPRARAGELDAVVTTWRNFERGGLAEEFRRFSLIGSSYLVSVTYANRDFFDKLPARYQALIRDAAAAAARIERSRTIELNERARRGLTQDQGIRSVFQSQEHRRRFAEALRPAYEGSIEGRIGKGLVEKIRQTGDAREFPLSPSDIAKR